MSALVIVSANLIRLYIYSLRIYAKPVLGASFEDISSGSTEISAIYETINELEEALKLLEKAVKLLEEMTGSIA